MSESPDDREKLIRTFLAIELPTSIQEELSQAGMDLGLELPRNAIRWVKPANIHLTLKFLGDTPVDLLPNITQELDRITSRLEPFVLSLGELGCFPNPRRPRIIWIGLEGDVNQLVNLQEMVESAADNLGWNREKREFHPHLTIGRVKNNRLIDRSRLPYGRKLLDKSFNVDSVFVIRSILKPTGAVYSQLIRSRL